MYLNKVTVKNFKAITDMELSFTPGVNLLIGDNGTGKSSMLEAIGFKTSGKGGASTEISYGIPAEITAFIDMDSEENAN